MPRTQLDAPHAVGVPAHDPHVVLVEAHGQPKVGGNEDLLLPVGLADLHQLVVLVHLDGPDAVVPDVFQGGEGDALHGTLPGDHDQVALLLHLLHVEHDLYPLAALHLEDVDDVGALGRLARLGNLVALLLIHLALVGEEQDLVVGGGGKDALHHVLLPGGDALLAHAALGLGGVLAGGGALEVARLGHGKDALLLLDQVLDVDVVLHEADLGLAVVPVLVPDLDELILQHAPEHLLVGEQLVVVGDLS